MSKERHTGNREEGHKRENEKKPAAGQRKRFVRTKDNGAARPAGDDRREKPARSYNKREDSGKAENDSPKRPYGTRQDTQKDTGRPKRSYGTKPDYGNKPARPNRNTKEDSPRDSDRPKKDYNKRQDSPRDGDRPKRDYNTREDSRKDSDRPKRDYNTRQDSPRDSDRPKRDYNTRQDSPRDNDRPKRDYNKRQDARPDSDRPKRYAKPERDERPKRTKGGRPDQFFAKPDKKQERPEKYTDEKPARRFKDNDRPKRTFDKRTVNADKNPVKKETAREENEPGAAMPLNKYVAHCGISSRREAVDLIKEGKITVNGEVMLQPGYKVEPTDKIEYGGKVISSQKNLVYILLNKPKNYITTTEDPQERKTVMELIADAGDERVYPVGRLDRNTTGLLLLTNDGELAQKLSHPKYNIKKLYQVTLDKPLTKLDFEKIMEGGLTLEDGEVKVDAMAYVDKKNEIGIEIHSGRNRIVRRIFEHLGYQVDKLDRVMYAGLTKKNIPRGKWRFLNEQEVINLKYFKQ